MVQHLVLRENEKDDVHIGWSSLTLTIVSNLLYPFYLFVDAAAVANAAISSSHEHDTDVVSNVVDEANAEIATDNATLEEHVSDDKNLVGRSPNGEIFVWSISNRSEGEDVTDTKDTPAAIVMHNPRDVKEHFNKEQRCPPCPPPDHFLTHFPKWPYKGGCKICDT